MKLHPRIVEILNNRNIVSEPDIAEFISDKPKLTYDPFLMPDMYEGVDLILSAAEAGAGICIYGDYDADGVTSTVILMEVLSQISDNLSFYIPSRFDEGYGLHKKSLKKIAARGVELVVTVDCGSTSVEEVEYAKELGMEILVTDHHTLGEEYPDCPIINPARRDSEYPFRYLAGCGVAFKLAQAITKEAGLSSKVLTSVLDMVAIGTVADIVSLTDENRTMVKYGLRLINTGNRIGLNSLIDVSGLKKGQIKAENISFGIAPRVNAAGRMKHAMLAAELFLTRDKERADELAEELVECNNYRKDRQNIIFDNCVELVENTYSDFNFLLLDPKQSEEGIAGIVCGQVKEKYYLPSVLVTDVGEGKMKGTGRSIEGLDLYAILKKYKHMFTAFGGHPAACGFTLKSEYLEELRTGLNDDASEIRKQNPELFERHIDTDITLNAADLSTELVAQFELLEPCGAGNSKPKVEILGYADSISRMGKDANFLRFTVITTDHGRLPAVCFNKADENLEIIEESKGSVLSFMGALTVNEWNGRKNLQLLIEAIE